MEKLLTVKDLGELLQVSPKTIYQWTHMRKIPYYKLPKGIRFELKKIQQWLKRKEMKRSLINIDI